MGRAAAAILAIVLAACAAPPQREVVVGLAEYAFVPPRIEVAPGERVRITVRNTGRLEHDLAPDQRGVALGLRHLHVGPAGSASLDWTAPTNEVEIRFVCSITGHEGLGMTGVIVVRRAEP